MKKLSYLFVLCLLFLSHATLCQSVGINTDTPHSSSVLDIQSTNKGILIPRITTAKRVSISDPATGLIVYDTNTKSLWFYDSTWHDLGTGNTFTNKNGIVYNTGDLSGDHFLFGAETLPSGASDTDSLMFFNKTKAAFRTGMIQNNIAWNEDSLGMYSFATGHNSKATGESSVSGGASSSAQGLASTAFGRGTRAGETTSFAAGNYAEATGNSSVAMGDRTEATGFSATALGYFSDATSSYAFAAGQLNEASGSASVALGSQNKATKTASTAMGIQTEATGTYSTSMGRGTKSESYNSMALGRFNVGGGNPSLWVAGDPLFEIGIGTDASNKANALTVLKDGKTGIGTEIPQRTLDVRGDGQILLNSSTTSPHLTLHETSTSDYARLQFANDNTETQWTIAGRPSADTVSSKLNFFLNGKGDIMTIHGNERVGVNSANPAAALHIDAKAGDDLLRVQRDGQTKFRLLQNGGAVIGANWNTALADVFRVDMDHTFFGYDFDHVPQARLEVDGAIRLGNTTATVSAGTMRFNNSNSEFEGFDGTQWGGLGQDADADPNNEIQTISKTGNTVTLSNGGGSFLDNNIDGDFLPTNELQNLSISGDVLSISSGNSVTIPSGSGGPQIQDPSGDQVVDADRFSPTGEYIGIDVDGMESFSFHRQNNTATLAFSSSNNNIAITGFLTPNMSSGHGNVTIGNATQSTSVSGDTNVIIGRQSTGDFSGKYNVIIGNITGSASGNRIRNVLIGYATGQSLTGNSVIAIGDQAGNGSGQQSVHIGRLAGPTSNYSRGGTFGYLATTTASNEYITGNAITTQIGGYEPWSNVSDGRFKMNVQENIPGLAFINALRPVTYQVDGEAVERFIRGNDRYASLDADYRQQLEDSNRKTESGFIAQEVELAANALGYSFDGVNAPQNEEDPYALAYAVFVTPLVKAVQELSDQVTRQRNTNSALDSDLAELQKQLISTTEDRKQLQKELDQLKAESTEIKAIMKQLLAKKK